MTERYGDFFDELVGLFSLRAAHHVGMTDAKVVTALRQIFAEALGTGLTSDDLDKLLAAEAPSRDRVASKVAWTISHALDAKVWGVNLQLTSERDGLASSPLLQQIERAGVTVADCNWRRSYDSFKALRPRWQTSVDALAVSHDRRCIYLVKGATFSSVRNLQPRLAVVGGSKTLFNPGDRLLLNVHAPADALATLLLATTIVQGRFGDARVVPVFAVVDDIDAGWQFEAIDVSDATLRMLPKKAPVCLDGFPVIASSLKFQDALREDPDFLNRTAASTAISPLYSMPPDRRARSLMILDVLRSEQAANEKEVVPVSPSRIREVVGERFDLHYPVDMARHDLLACDQGRQLIARVRGSGPRYTATPVGLARYYWAIMKLSNPPAGFVDSVMDKIFHHAELVWKARGL
jgi:hypothetical protein